MLAQADADGDPTVNGIIYKCSETKAIDPKKAVRPSTGRIGEIVSTLCSA